MRRPHLPAVLGGLLGLFAWPAGAASAAEPAGRATAASTPHDVHVLGNTSAHPARAARRRSLSFFAQLTDAQLADEASPARLELMRESGSIGMWRPHEALGPQTFDQAVRNINAHSTSRMADAIGQRALLGFAIYTGDLADNQQANEVRWGVRILNGGRVDPFSGRRVGPGNRCPGASRAVVRRLNAAVAARSYTGVQDRDDYVRAGAWARSGLYDPDVSAPRYPGLLDRAQRPFSAEGLNVPWYGTRGNHDALVQGFFGARPGAGVATGCRKVFPSGRRAPGRGNPWDAMVERLRRGGFRWVPPDPRRRLVTPRSFKRLHGRADRGHGFGLVQRRELRASRGAAAYYSFVPRPGLRFVAIDTVGEGGGADGNIDHPQYRWLARTLQTSHRRGELVVVYGHHSLETMRNPRPDELAGPCGRGLLGCDADPRRSTPVHLGRAGRASLRSLLLRHRNVVLFVTGHLHSHRAAAHVRRGRDAGFWQLTTASHISFPQHTRLIELMDNGDGTLSIFATALGTASPAAAPPADTPAWGLGEAQLGSISRRLAATVRGVVPAQRDSALSGAPNLELVVPDPRAR